MQGYKKGKAIIDPINLQSPLSLTDKEWGRCKAHFGNRCAYCGGGGKLTKDHIIPRYYGGCDMAFNIAPVCPRCNSSKGKKSIYKWYSHQPFYNPIRMARIIGYMANKLMTAGLFK